MKWIGQHIWDFISRFRSDVYLEKVETGTIASGGNLGLDSNNKIVKANESSGGVAFDGSTVDGVCTFKDADEMNVLSNATMTNGGLAFSGNATIDIGNTLIIDVDSGMLNIQDAGAQKIKLGNNGIDFTDNTAAEIIFEGATDNAHKTKINVVDPTGTNTFSLPNHTGIGQTTNKHVVILQAAFWANSTSGYYLTIGGGTTGESSNLSQASYTNVFNCPYDGQVLRASASTQTTGSKTVKLEMYIDKDDSDLVSDQRGSDWNVASYNSSWVADSPGDWTFSKGENIAIRATDSSATYGTQYTVVLEFDLTT